MVATGLGFVLVLASALAAPLVVYALIRAETTDPETTDRETAERRARERARRRK